MQQLTNEQMAWALNWASYHLIEHDIKKDAAKELTHCAKHFTEAAARERGKDNGRTKKA